MHYNALWSNYNAFSLIICKVYTKRENVGSWNSGPEKATSELPILHIFKWAENLRRIVFEYMEYLRNIGANNYQRGPTWARQGPQACPGGLCPPRPTSGAIFWYIGHFDLEKIRVGLSGRSTAVSRRNLGRSTFALRQSDSAGGTSLPEGEIIVIIITNNSPILGRAIFINIFNNTISSQTLVHLLCSIFVSNLRLVHEGASSVDYIL